MGLEYECAMLAIDVVKKANGEISFDEYDKAMKSINYFTPINWIAGWGLSPHLCKANHDKMCALKACQLELLEQTETGYKIKE